MVHGYYMTLGTRTYLGFTRDAPIFRQMFLQMRDSLGLSESCLSDDSWQGFVNKARVVDDGLTINIIGYSVVRKGEGNGFLWSYDQYEQAMAEAKQFTELFGRPYECLALKSRADDSWILGDAFG